MNLISRYLHASHIVLDAPYTNKKRAFEAVAQLFEDHNKLARSAAYDALFTRERMGSTALGQSMAIPHGRVKGLKDTLCAVVRLASAIPFEAPDNAPVQLLVVLLVPENANQKHLDLLGELASLLSLESFRASVLAAPSVAEVHHLFLASQAHSVALT